MIQKSGPAFVLCGALVAACGDAQATDPLFHLNLPSVDGGALNAVTGPDSAVRMDATAPGPSVGDGDGSASNPQLDSGSNLPGNGGGDGAMPSNGNGDAGSSGDGDSNAQGETGRMIGMTAAHNAVRAMVSMNGALPPLTWSPTLAAYAQQWADNQAQTACSNPQHRSETDLMKVGYGENLALFGGHFFSGPVSTAQQAVNGWAAEVACWTYGTICGFGVPCTEMCNVSCYTSKAINSDGCGHYTQIVWRDTLEVGCGVASCQDGSQNNDIWICNYSPPGNFAGQAPY